MSALGSSAAGAFFGCPWWYHEGPPGAANADEFARVLWITQLVPIAIDATWAGISAYRGAGAVVARLDFTVGTVLAWILGVVDLGLTITWSVFALREDTDDLAGVAQSWLGSLPGALKILHATPIAEAS
jgi:hypothetical protein